MASTTEDAEPPRGRLAHYSMMSVLNDDALWQLIRANLMQFPVVLPYCRMEDVYIRTSRGSGILMQCHACVYNQPIDLPIKYR